MAPPLNLQQQPFFQFGSGVFALESRIKILENDVKERDLKSSRLQRDIGEKDVLISQLQNQIEDKDTTISLQDLAITQLEGQVEDKDSEIEELKNK